MENDKKKRITDLPILDANNNIQNIAVNVNEDGENEEMNGQYSTIFGDTSCSINDFADFAIQGLDLSNTQIIPNNTQAVFASDDIECSSLYENFTQQQPNKRMYTCAICGKWNTNQNEYIEHVKSHSTSICTESSNPKLANNTSEVFNDIDQFTTLFSSQAQAETNIVDSPLKVLCSTIEQESLSNASTSLPITIGSEFPDISINEEIDAATEEQPTSNLKPLQDFINFFIAPNEFVTTEPQPSAPPTLGDNINEDVEVTHLLENQIDQLTKLGNVIVVDEDTILAENKILTSQEQCTQSNSDQKADENDNGKDSFKLLIDQKTLKSLLNITMLQPMANGLCNNNNTKKFVSNNYSCGYCKLKFQCKEILINHLCKFHQDDYTSPKVCGFCSEIYENRRALQDHLTQMHKIRPSLKCYICHNVFKTKNALKRHEKMHIDLAKYNCPLCGLLFTGSHVLLQHIESHHPFGSSLRMLCCLVCNITFSKEKELLQHLKSAKHMKKTKDRMNDVSSKSSERPYQYLCNMCSMHCQEESDIILHIQNIHKKERYCKICNMVFFYKSELKNHYTKHKDQVKDLNNKCENKISDECTTTTEEILRLLLSASTNLNQTEITPSEGNMANKSRQKNNGVKQRDQVKVRELNMSEVRKQHRKVTTNSQSISVDTDGKQSMREILTEAGNLLPKTLNNTAETLETIDISCVSDLIERLKDVSNTHKQSSTTIKKIQKKECLGSPSNHCLNPNLKPNISTSFDPLELIVDPITTNADLMDTNHFGETMIVNDTNIDEFQIPLNYQETDTVDVNVDLMNTNHFGETMMFNDTNMIDLQIPFNHQETVLTQPSLPVETQKKTSETTSDQSVRKRDSHRETGPSTQENNYLSRRLIDNFKSTIVKTLLEKLIDDIRFNPSVKVEDIKLNNKSNFTVRTDKTAERKDTELDIVPETKSNLPIDPVSSSPVVVEIKRGDKKEIIEAYRHYKYRKRRSGMLNTEEFANVDNNILQTSEATTKELTNVISDRSQIPETPLPKLRPTNIERDRNKLSEVLVPKEVPKISKHISRLVMKNDQTGKQVKIQSKRLKGGVRLRTTMTLRITSNTMYCNDNGLITDRLPQNTGGHNTEHKVNRSAPNLSNGVEEMSEPTQGSFSRTGEIKECSNIRVDQANDENSKKCRVETEKNCKNYDEVKNLDKSINADSKDHGRMIKQGNYDVFLPKNSNISRCLVTLKELNGISKITESTNPTMDDNPISSSDPVVTSSDRIKETVTITSSKRTKAQIHRKGSDETQRTVPQNNASNNENGCASMKKPPELVKISKRIAQKCNAPNLQLEKLPVNFKDIPLIETVSETSNSNPSPFPPDSLPFLPCHTSKRALLKRRCTSQNVIPGSGKIEQSNHNKIDTVENESSSTKETTELVPKRITQKTGNKTSIIMKKNVSAQSCPIISSVPQTVSKTSIPRTEERPAKKKRSNRFANEPTEEIEPSETTSNILQPESESTGVSSKNPQHIPKIGKQSKSKTIIQEAINWRKPSTTAASSIQICKLRKKVKGKLRQENAVLIETTPTSIQPMTNTIEQKNVNTTKREMQRKTSPTREATMQRRTKPKKATLRIHVSTQKQKKSKTKKTSTLIPTSQNIPESVQPASMIIEQTTPKITQSHRVTNKKRFYEHRPANGFSKIIEFNSPVIVISPLNEEILKHEKEEQIDYKKQTDTILHPVCALKNLFIGQNDKQIDNDERLGKGHNLEDVAFKKQSKLCKSKLSMENVLGSAARLNDNLQSIIQKTQPSSDHQQRYLHEPLERSQQNQCQLQQSRKPQEHNPNEKKPSVQYPKHWNLQLDSHKQQLHQEKQQLHQGKQHRKWKRKHSRKLQKGKAIQ